MHSEPFEKVIAAHHGRFHARGFAFAAPARVNLIGEHTDYTGGFVLPIAIGFRTVAVVSAASGPKSTIYSANFEESVAVDLAALEQTERNHWSAYPFGVAWSLQKESVLIPPFCMTIEGDVPLGSGLSSSASIEVATAMALLSLGNRQLSGKQIAVACRRAENDFVGASSGIMDQFVITNAQAERALLLDCRSLEYELLPLPEHTRVVVVNSMVKHSVANGEYGDRRGEVDRGQAALHAANPRIEFLRDATLADLQAARSHMDDAAFHRCRHIITENERVMQMKDALAAGDRARIGALLYAAHVSFRDDFAASCPEVDALVEMASKIPGCIGARITGGGFGGCTVNLVEERAAERFMERIQTGYRERYGIDAQAYSCKAVDGALALAANAEVHA